ncbi:hypothetical protein MKC43_17595 [[Clostridium] innocuum]|nr:hypothetical protein [[Clostridium] innocuum]
MKFIIQNGIMMFLEKPITRLSVFEIETIDAMLSMCEPAFIKMQEDFKVSIDFTTFKFQLLKTMGEFLRKCHECSEACLSNAHKHVEAKRYERNHIDSTRWPTRLQKNDRRKLLHYGVLHYICGYFIPLFIRCRNRKASSACFKRAIDAGIG